MTRRRFDPCRCTARLLSVAGVILWSTAGSHADFSSNLTRRWDQSYAKCLYEIKLGRIADGGSHWQAWQSDQGPVDMALRRTRALLEDVSSMPGAPSMSSYRTQLETYRSQAAGKATDKELYRKICGLRREIAMRNPLLDFDSLIFVGSESKNPMFHSGHMAIYMKEDPGAGLYMVKDFKGTSPSVRDLLATARVQGGRFAGERLSNKNSTWNGRAVFSTPELSFDASEIMFVWAQQGDNKAWWHASRDNLKDKFRIFAMDLDGDNLRPFCHHDTPWDDYDPLYLPSGRIVFVSDRHNGGQRCGKAASSGNMYSAKPDGSDLYRISWHETNERCPSLTLDGKIVYSRWDYIDRHAYSAQSMWLCNPDGSDPRAPHGNYIEDDKPFHPISECDIRQIPDKNGKFVAIETGHHRAYYGNLVVIDIERRAKVEDQIRYFIPYSRPMRDNGKPTYDERFTSSKYIGRRYFTTPWPLSEDYVIACEYSEILLVDKFGNEILLYDASDHFSIKVASPIPVKSRTPPSPITPVTYQGERRPDAPRAVISVMDVYDSDFEWPPNTKITELRICQVIGRPKAPWNTGINVNIGYSDGALIKYVIGTVPVEEDGSAYFEAPIEREIYFQALDSTGMAVQNMLSGTYVHPGEHLSCVGCHESKWDTPTISGTPKALRRPPSKIEPEVDGSYPLSYYRLVKHPVFDKKCMPCHRDQNKGIDFEYWNTNFGDCNERKGLLDARVGQIEKYLVYYNAAYDKTYCRTPENELFMGFPGTSRSRSIAGEIGARACPLLDVVRQHEKQGKIDLTYEEFHRITLWMDLNCNEMGTYDLSDEARERTVAGEVVWPSWEGSGVDPNNPTGVQRTWKPTPSRSPGAPMRKAPPELTMVNGRLRIANLPPGKATLTLCTLAGRTVLRSAIDARPGSREFAVPMGEKPAAGIYLAGVRQGDKTVLSERIAVK